MISFGASAPVDEDGADDEVGVLQRLLDLERRGHEERHAAAQDLVEVAHAVDRALEDRHLRAHPDRDDGGVVADHAAAHDEDAARGNACDAAEQDSATTLRPLEVVRARLRRQPAGDLAHRREQRQRAVRLDGLVRDRGHARLDERPREQLVGGDVQVREERQPGPQPRIFGLDRLLHLEQELGAPPDVVDGDDRGAGPLVRVVRESAAHAGLGLDEHVVAALDELARPRRRQRDAVLLRLDLLRNAYPHRARDDTSSHCARRKETP